MARIEPSLLAHVKRLLASPHIEAAAIVHTLDLALMHAKAKAAEEQRAEGAARLAANLTTPRA